MPNNDPAIEISIQPDTQTPDTALEKVDPPNLAVDLDSYRKREKDADIQKKEYALFVEQVMLEERKKYASRLFWLSVVWLIFIGVYLALAGFGVLKTADSVLIALISTTTANVLGLFYIVARWLFPNKASDGKDDQPKTS